MPFACYYDDGAMPRYAVAARQTLFLSALSRLYDAHALLMMPPRSVLSPALFIT